jgi:hypothetical protein
MNHVTFTKIVEARLADCRDRLIKKGAEYATDTDRLHNFKVTGNMLGVLQERALVGMWVKHLVSVLDIVEGNTAVTKYLINEKLGDVICYAILLEACLLESNRFNAVNQFSRERMTDLPELGIDYKPPAETIIGGEKPKIDPHFLGEVPDQTEKGDGH